MSAPQPAPHFAYRPDIDGLRAVAVLAVVVYHFVPLFAPGGYVGVDVFFVVSGYLITAISLGRMRRDRFSFVDFYARRARRLLPSVAVVLLVTLVVGSRLYGPRALAGLGEAAGAAALFGANLHFFATLDYFNTPIETQPLLHLWSLGVEEQFYLLAPVGLLALHRRTRLLQLAAAVLVGGSLSAAIWATDAHPRAAFYLPMFRAWELGLGAGLAIAPMPVRSLATRTGLGVAGIGAITVSVYGMDDATPFPGFAALLPTLGTLAVLQAGPDTVVGRVLSLSWMRAVGRWSYAWYLWHWPVLVFSTFWLERPPSPLEALGLGGLSLAIAAASTEWLETPLRHWKVDQPWAAVRLGGLTSAALAGMGLSVWLAHDPGDSVVSTARLNGLMHAPEPNCDSFPTQGLPILVCAIGTPAPPLDLLVLGDSHAAALAAPLRAMAMDQGMQGLVVTRNDCPPLLDVERADLPADQSCDEHTDAVFAFVEQARPARVVLHARWPLYVEKSRVGDRERAIPRLVRAGSKERPADLTAALLRTTRRLQDLGAEVFLVGSIPEATFDIPTVVKRNAQVGKPPPKGPLVADFEVRRARSKAMLEAVSGQTGARVLQPSDRLCTGSHCLVAADGTALYYDDNHLDVAGAEWVMPALAPIVQGDPAPSSGYLQRP